MPGATEAREFHWPIRVYYEDSDAAGIVYHANYLRFMERARTEWLRHIGYEQDELAANPGIAFVVGKITLSYKSPARFNEELDVVSAVVRRGRVSLEFAQRIVCMKREICSAWVKVGCVDTVTLRPRAIPKAIFIDICNAS